MSSSLAGTTLKGLGSKAVESALRLFWTSAGLEVPTGRSIRLRGAQGEDGLGLDFVHLPRRRPCTRCAVLGGESSLDNGRFPSLFLERVSDSLEVSMVDYSRSRSFDNKVEIVCCDAYDGIWITRDVPSLTGLRSRREVEGIIDEKDSYRHDVGFPVRIACC